MLRWPTRSWNCLEFPCCRFLHSRSYQVWRPLVELRHCQFLCLRGLWGGGNPFPQPGRGTERRYFSTSLLNQLISPVVLALDQNERGMWPAIWPNDLVLLDRSPIERRRPEFEHVYALSWEGEGWVGRCRVVGGALVVVVDNARQAHSLHGPVPLDGKEVLDIVRGKIVWVGRDLM